jgi:CRP-like cAMP-binding protein
VVLRPIDPVLAALPPELRTRLLERAVPRRLETGEALWLAGSSDRLALLIRGLLKLSARDAAGAEVILRLAWPGELVGELLPGATPPPCADAIAAAPSSVLVFDVELAEEALRCSPEALSAQASILSSHLRSAYRKVLEHSTANSLSRLAGVLLDLAEATGEIRDGVIEMELPVGQVELGRLVGSSRETTCKGLSRLRRKGIVDYERRRVTILRPELLRAIRCGERASTPSP